VNWIWCLIFIRYVDLAGRGGMGEKEGKGDVNIGLGWRRGEKDKC
jgi:hypothetical protein